MVSGFVPRALLHMSRLSSLFHRLPQARQDEMYLNCAEMTKIAQEWTRIYCASLLHPLRRSRLVGRLRTDDSDYLVREDVICVAPCSYLQVKPVCRTTA
jgi:hypothetical protein